MFVKLVTSRNLLLLVLAACGTKPASPAPIANSAHSSAPARDQYAALDDDGRCHAMMPRAVPCIDQLMREEMVATGMAGSDADYMMDKVAKKPADAETNEKVWTTMCVADVKPRSTPDAVYACWDSADCATLAKCVAQRTWTK